jgi:hypothetical protein
VAVVNILTLINVLAAVLFLTKKGKSVTVCIGQILDIDDQEFQLKYMKKSGKTGVGVYDPP